MTQAELIARALDMEEGNILEHRNYLANEAEKRKRAHVVRTVVKGPLLRWVSRREEVKVVEEVAPPLPPTPPMANLGSYPYGQYYLHAYSQYSYPSTTSTSYPSASPYSLFAFNSITHVVNIDTTHPVYQNGNTATMSSDTHPAASSNAVPPIANGSYPTYPSFHAPTAPQRVEKTVVQERNYAIHELGQNEDAPMPQWKETMAAMFGDHVKWEDLRVYASKGRPLGMLHLPISLWPY